MQASDSSLGPYLRSEREQQGIDLKDIAELTKIQPKFIEAIEDDAYDQLPKGPFVVGFLRSYAECLSIDADEVVTFYQTSYGASTPNAPLPLERPSPAVRPSPEPRASSRRGGVVSVGLAVLVCALLYGLWSGFLGSRPVSDSDPGIANEAQSDRPIASPAKAPAGASLASGKTGTATGIDSQPNTSAAANLAVDPTATDSQRADTGPSDGPITLLSEASAPVLAPLVLRVYALEETWLRLDIDDETRQEALIKAGQSQQWRADEQFSLTIGNVQGARVFLDDQELDLGCPKWAFSDPF